MPQPVANPRATSATELKAHIEAERAGAAFLVYREQHGEQVIVPLPDCDARVVLGRGASADVTLSWDERVSRVHAELERIADRWSLVDDGLSLNGSYANGAPIRGRRLLHDGDRLELGDTTILFRDPDEADARSTAAASEASRGRAAVRPPATDADRALPPVQGPNGVCDPSAERADRNGALPQR